LKTFIDTTDKFFHFSSCEGCPARCCDGREGSVYSELLLEEFERVSKNFPILFTFGDLGFLKANVLLSNGKNFCPYIKDHKCIIYEDRPQVCRNYPLSAHIDNKIYIDDSCPAIGIEGISILEKGRVSESFDNSSLHNYQEKFINTHNYLQEFNKKENFDLVVTINGIDFFQYMGDSKDKFIQLHIKSLKNIQKVLQCN
jgi:Fe-S-cluster containining protein